MVEPNDQLTNATRRKRIQPKYVYADDAGQCHATEPRRWRSRYEPVNDAEYDEP